MSAPVRLVQITCASVGMRHTLYGLASDGNVYFAMGEKSDDVTWHQLSPLIAPTVTDEDRNAALVLILKHTTPRTMDRIIDKVDEADKELLGRVFEQYIAELDAAAADGPMVDA